MTGLDEKISYLQGLIEGMGYNEDSNEGKLFITISEILESMAIAITTMEKEQAELEQYVEVIDEDLSLVEDELLDIDDFDDFDASRYIEIECPGCQETVYFDEDIFDNDDDIICPNCTKVIYSEDKEKEIERLEED